ncbi:Crp/Fnr family transcriptional regulator [Microvirga lenta]|uniref:Crp/Fnr family transcriptional regulator n=1 Tax=Microvirga lenta TaxID=2881337 RepID=UPI001CFFBE63|nr:Crp/Fnr family transcriptional regulator [Microvirga lenta]MCB5176682.1 Crp/Fnr family transcriptional regulator [Microvirga lenta]
MPPSELEYILTELELAVIPRGSILQDYYKKQDHVFFIESGLVSLQAKTNSDDPVEVGVLGRMGMVGAPVVLGTLDAPLRAVMLIPGEALMISAASLRAAMARTPVLHDLLLGYTQAITVQNSQLVLCSSRHETEQRLARWLLLAHDWLKCDLIPVTHETLSNSLTVRRPSVTVAISNLKEAGAIHTDRGCITIASRPRLERLACGCYRVIRYEYARLLEKTLIVPG